MIVNSDIDHLGSKTVSHGFTAAKRQKYDRAFGLVILLLLCLVLGPRLFRSFWVDEAGTFWMAHEGPIAAIQHTWHWPGQSVLFAVISSFFSLQSGPLREFVLRIPALIGLLVAFYFVYRLAEAAIGRGSGFIAVALFAFHPITLQMGEQARPYSLALAAVTGSCWALYEWVETRERRFLVSFVIASTLIIYLHYFFTFLFVCQMLYLLYVFAVERRLRRWAEILGAYIVAGALALPLWPHMRLLLHEAHTLPFVKAVSFIQVTDYLLPSLPMFSVVAAALLVQFLFPNSLHRPRALNRAFLVLTFCWWVLGPLVFFIISLVTPMRIFLPRYLAFSAPAQSLLIAYAGFSVFGASMGRLWALAAVLLSIASPSPWSILAGRHVGIEELRPFLQIIRRESISHTPPVFYSSPLPESNFYDWQSGLAKGSYLYAPFVAYPMKNKLLPLPYRLTDEVKAHISNVIQSELTREPEVIFVTHSTHELEWNSWLTARMKEAGYNAETVEPNAYSVTIFKRPDQH
jgi:Dolichyl-phosphate-mannose-protein mannosyltransferase